MKIFTNKYFLYAVLLIVLIIFILWVRKRHFRAKVANTAVQEYVLWNLGKTSETNPKMRATLTGYWNAAKAPDYGYSQAWSAAFISAIFKKAGAGNKFPYSPRHSDYIRASIRNRKSGKKIGAIVGYKPNEYAPKIGDLICFPRQSGITYDTDNTYESHCGVVVDIDRKNNKAITVDGNISDSSNKQSYNLDNKGYVTDKKVHVVIKNAIK